MGIIRILARAMTALNAFLTTTVQEWLFVQGKSMSFEDYFTFSADEVKTFVVDPTSFTGVNLTFNPISLSATSGPVRVDFYAGTTADEDGTLLGASNRRSGFPAPVTKIRLNPSNISLGTRFAGDLVPATGTAPANSNGSGNQPSLPFEPSKTTKSAFTITNDNGADTIIQIKLTWFEA